MYQWLWGNHTKLPPIISLQNSLICGNKDINRLILWDSVSKDFPVWNSGALAWCTDTLK